MSSWLGQDDGGMFHALICSFGVLVNLWVVVWGKINFPLEDKKEEGTSEL